MPVFVWEGRSKDGKVNGEMDAPGKSAVIARLRSGGVLLSPADIRLKSGHSTSGNSANGRPESVFPFHRKTMKTKVGINGFGGTGFAERLKTVLSTEIHMGSVQTSVVCNFTRKFSVMTGAGVEISRALEVLASQETDKRFKRALRRTLDAVNAGDGLPEAMEKSPEAFPPFYTGLVRAAGAGGDMGGVLSRFADSLMKSELLRKKVRTAMIYPLVVVGTAAAVMFAALAFLVPVFTQVFADMGAPLPALTQTVADTAFFVKENLLPIFAGIAFLAFAPSAVRNRSGRAAVFVDKTVFLIPVFGEMAHKAALSRFCGALSSLLRGGVPLVSALESVSSASANRFFSREVVAAARRMVKGGGVAEAFSAGGRAFPAVFVSMVDAGERSGRLPQMLEVLSETYMQEADALSAAVQSSVESGAILIVGIVVSVIVISMYLPIFSMVSLFSG